MRSIHFAGAILAVGLVYEGMALKMPLGTLAYPGPGLFPAIVGAFLVATSLGCVLQEIVPRLRARQLAASPPAGAQAAKAGGHDRSKTVQLTALMVGYTVVLKPLGFPLAIFAFVAVAIRIFGHRRWGRIVAMAAVIGALSYVSFAVWLKVPLPLGILEDVLG